MSDQEQLNRILDLVGVASCSIRVGLCAVTALVGVTGNLVLLDLMGVAAYDK